MAPPESTVKIDAALVWEVADHEANSAIPPAERVQFHHLPTWKGLAKFLLYNTLHVHAIIP